MQTCTTKSKGADGTVAVRLMLYLTRYVKSTKCSGTRSPFRSWSDFVDVGVVVLQEEDAVVGMVAIVLYSARWWTRVSEIKISGCKVGQ